MNAPGEVRALLVVVMVALSSCAAAAPAAEVECGATMPVSVSVDGPGASQLLRPSAGPFDGSVVREWELLRHTIDVQWPAGQRELFADRRPTAADDVGVDVRVNFPGELLMELQSAYDSAPFASVDVIVPDVVTLDAMPVECQSMLLTVTGDDGGRSTLEVHLASSALAAPVDDFGPLIVHRMVLDHVLQPAEAALCPGAHAQRHLVNGAPAMPTAPEALRAFLESPASSAVPRSTAWRPFDEIHPPDYQTPRPATNTIRYEHFLAWTQFVGVDVTAVPSGWVATAWLVGVC